MGSIAGETAEDREFEAERFSIVVLESTHVLCVSGG